MINLTFDEETGIVRAEYSHSVEKADVEKFMEFLQTEERLPPNLKVYHKAGSTNTSMRVKDVLYLAQTMHKATSRFISVRAAVYTTHPLSLTLSKMYERVNFNKNTRYKTFNTERASIAWLMSI